MDSLSVSGVISQQRPALAIALSIFTILALSVNQAVSQEIDLSKPVRESGVPLLLVWDFDLGVEGGSEPASVPNGSEVGLTGELLADADGALPVYAEGRFGVGLEFRPPEAQPDARPPLGPRVSSTPSAADGEEAFVLDLAKTSFLAGLWVRPSRVQTNFKINA